MVEHQLRAKQKQPTTQRRSVAQIHLIWNQRSKRSRQLKSKNPKSLFHSQERLFQKTWRSPFPGEKNNLLNERRQQVCLRFPGAAPSLLLSVVLIHWVLDSRVMEPGHGRILKPNEGKNRTRGKGGFSLRMENEGNFIQGCLNTLENQLKLF